MRPDLDRMTAALALLAALAGPVLAQNPGAPAGGASTLSSEVAGQMQHATELLSYRRYAEAETLWRVVVAAVPRNADAQAGLAASLAGQGKARGALAAYVTALALDRTQPLARDYLRSLTKARRDLIQSAAATLAGAWAAPRSGEYRVVLAEAYRRLRLYPEARAAYEQVLADQPGSVPALAGLGRTLVALGDLDGGERNLRAALAADPRRAVVHCGLGEAFVVRGLVNPATEQFQEAIRLDATLADAQLGLGRLLQAHGQLDQALTRLVTAADLDPKSAAAHHALGLCHFARGATMAAVQQLRLAIGLEPDDAQVAADLDAVRATPRVVRVHAVVDDSFRRYPDWESQIAERLNAASAQTSTQVGLSFVLAGCSAWQPPSGLSNYLDLVSELRRTVPRGDADIVIAFSREDRVYDPQMPLHVFGISPNFSGYTILNDLVVLGTDGTARTVRPEAQLETIIHELGHLFGAVHRVGPSVMRPIPSTPAIHTLDDLNARLIDAARWIEFEGGLESLSAHELRQMADLYQEISSAGGADYGVHLYLAFVYHTLNDAEPAIAQYRAVLVMEPEEPFANFNLGSLYRDQGRFDEARRYFQKVISIGEPQQIVEQARTALLTLGG